MRPLKCRRPAVPDSASHGRREFISGSKLLVFVLIGILLLPLFVTTAFAAVQVKKEDASNLGGQESKQEIKPVTDLPKDLQQRKQNSNKNSGSLVNPDSVNAQIPGFPTLLSVASGYLLYRSASELAEQAINSATWFRDIILNGLEEIGWAISAGPECLPNEMRKLGIANCNISNRAIFEADYRPPGIAGFLAYPTTAVMDNPKSPVDMAYFINGTFGDTVFGKPAMAQLTEPSPFFDVAVFKVWTVSRNVAIGLVALALGVSALAIMFRQRIGAQTVVSIYSILPYIPIVLFLILFSYPIMVIAINLALRIFNSVGQLAAQLAVQISNDADFEVGRPLASDGYFIALEAIIHLFQIFPGVIISGWVILVMIIGVIIAVIAFIFQFLRVYVNFVYFTIFMPVVMLSALLPGRQNVIPYFFKKVGVEILMAPAIIFTAILGFTFLRTIIDDTLVFQGSAFSFITVFVKYSIGWSLLWGTTKVRKSIEGFFGVGESIWGPGGGGKK